MIPIQFMFEYEVVYLNPETGEEMVNPIWTTLKGKQELKGQDVIEVRLKRVENDRRN